MVVHRVALVDAVHRRVSHKGREILASEVLVRHPAKIPFPLGDSLQAPARDISLTVDGKGVEKVGGGEWGRPWLGDRE